MRAQANLRRPLRRFAACLVVAFSTLTAAMAWAYPALGAAFCPQCYGLERIAPRLAVEHGIGPAMRRQLIADLRAAHLRVAAQLGPFGGHHALVVCASNGCDRRLGGGGERGARATTLTTPFRSVIRVGPRGMSETILAHELAHVRVHAVAGWWAQISGGLPAWFDEGLAVIVSDDRRYVAADGTPLLCRKPSAPPLPSSPFRWAAVAGRPDIYAHAACDVSRWMARNGGMAGALRALRTGALLLDAR